MTDQKYGLVRDATTLFERTVEKSTQKRDIPYLRTIPFSESELASEEWRPIPGHESRWQVSSLGRIRNAERLTKYRKPTKPCLATRLKRDGYESFTTSFIDEGGKRWSIHLRVHRAVALAFLPNPALLPVVHHKDNNKLNNRLSNLKWATQKENMAYALDQVPGRRESLKQLHKYHKAYIRLHS